MPFGVRTTAEALERVGRSMPGDAAPWLMRSSGAKLGVGLLFGGAAVAGFASQHPVNRMFDNLSEVAFDTPDADNAFLGRDINASIFMNPLARPLPSAIAGGGVGSLIGGGAGAALGGWRGKWGAIVGGVVGALAGGSVGAAAGAISPIKPFLNSNVIGDAFREDKLREASMNMAARTVKTGFNRNDVLGSAYFYNPQVSRAGVAANDDYYTTGFPGPTNRPNRYSTGASGDLVLGLHNLRFK